MPRKREHWLLLKCGSKRGHSSHFSILIWVDWSSSKRESKREEMAWPEWDGNESVRHSQEENEIMQVDDEATLISKKTHNIEETYATWVVYSWSSMKGNFVQL